MEETTRKVTEQEVKKLYRFTRQHFVEHFDIQTELVDHLASSIESMWEENQNIKFEDALSITFKKFGIFGFSDIVEKKANALSKRYTKKILTRTLELLKWPKIISSLALAIVLYYIVVLFDYSKFSLAAIFIIGAIIGYFKLYSFQKKWKVKTKGVKLLSIESSIRSPGMVIYLVYFLMIQPLIIGREHYFGPNSWVLMAYVFGLSLFTLVTFESIYSLKEDIEKSYSKYLMIY